MSILLNTDLPELTLVARGKVRDIYDLGETLLIVTTDRISAFDVIMNEGIPDKGYVLTQISAFWFRQMEDIIPNHTISTELKDFPTVCQQYAEILEGRSMLVKKAKPLPVECIVRGFISGSGWKDYKSTGSICGILLPEGLLESAKLEQPIFNRWARDINADFLRLAERFWPGPLTIVLRRSATVSGLVTGGLDTVGIRVPAHPVAQHLLREFGGGVAAPSANRFGRISPTCADHVRDELGSAPDLILEGGDCQVGLESTIISLVDDRPTLLRPGGISLHELCEALGREVALPGQPDPALRAPGCHASHYAPQTPACMITLENIAAEVSRSVNTGRTVAVLCHTETVTDLFPATRCLLLPNDPVGYGQALYASLRLLDTGGYGRILIEAVPETEPWRAVRDRLCRAVCAHDTGV